MKLTPKQKLTVFSISESMANTTRQEIEVVSILATPIDRLRYVNGPLESHRIGFFKPRGKRKIFHLDIRPDDLVFEGWDLPIITDWEVQRGGGMTSFSGNACFNLGIGGKSLVLAPEHAQFVRDFITEHNLNLPLLDGTKAKCILVRPGDHYGEGELLWPEIEIAHAVVNRMKDKLATATL